MRELAFCLAVLAGLHAASAIAAEGDPKRGAQVYRACHALEPGLKQAAFGWNAAALDGWVQNPAEMIPGNYMVFEGLADAKARADLVAFVALAGALSFFEGPANAADVSLYETPQCGCCEEYANHPRQNGFSVTVKPTHELVPMSRQAGIPDDFQGCHLAFIDGYVVSGHVPVNTVNRLLRERPDVKGVTLPGMPTGSPGMTGDETAPFTIYEIGPGRPKVYAVE